MICRLPDYPVSTYPTTLNHCCASSYLPRRRQSICLGQLSIQPIRRADDMQLLTQAEVNSLDQAISSRRNVKRSLLAALAAAAHPQLLQIWLMFARPVSAQGAPDKRSQATKYFNVGFK
ncbi:jg3502 [Pararge aegeria aegeria]|uniref:Jg3502 protein n=1 Tax=Pararge aegeria aegeria TaxID=348720 RepID=A0A8S4R6A7_9NEOP|nr:jg3502 [Pararge aegeria aegeria]